jgi:hypothetical protein
MSHQTRSYHPSVTWRWHSSYASSLHPWIVDNNKVHVYGETDELEGRPLGVGRRSRVMRNQEMMDEVSPMSNEAKGGNT